MGSLSSRRDWRRPATDDCTPAPRLRCSPAAVVPNRPHPRDSVLDPEPLGWGRLVLRVEVGRVDRLAVQALRAELPLDPRGGVGLDEVLAGQTLAAGLEG